MAHNKKLGDMTEFTTLVLDGVTPEDISKRFNVAISTVHNYKRQLQEQGLEIPSVRGKRPSGKYDDYPKGFAPLLTTHAKSGVAELPGTDTVSVAPEPRMDEHITFEVGEVQIRVSMSNGAQHVDVHHNHVVIHF